MESFSGRLFRSLLSSLILNSKILFPCSFITEGSGQTPNSQNIFYNQRKFYQWLSITKIFYLHPGTKCNFLFKDIKERYPRYKRSKNQLKSYLMKLEKWSKCISGLHDKLKVWAVNMSSNYHLCTEWGDRERKLKKTTVLAFPAILSTTT